MQTNVFTFFVIYVLISNTFDSNKGELQLVQCNRTWNA